MTLHARYCYQRSFSVLREVIVNCLLGLVGAIRDAGGMAEIEKETVVSLSDGDAEKVLRLTKGVSDKIRKEECYA